ncbi:MAG: DUF2202 domain-containing protein, partial [Acidimicrobiia bacterium]|nr:DUF2202 domain-containing protein [Acidimicrobiia bacterium]
FEKYRVPVPANASSASDIEVPDTFSKACSRAVEFELDNVKMYDEFLSFITHEDIRTAMTLLRRASKDRHLPAFRRWAGR